MPRVLALAGTRHAKIHLWISGPHSNNMQSPYEKNLYRSSTAWA